MVIPKATLNLPGQPPCLASSAQVRRRTIRQAKRTTSFPLNTNKITPSNRSTIGVTANITMSNDNSQPQSLPTSAGFTRSSSKGKPTL